VSKIAFENDKPVLEGLKPLLNIVWLVWWFGGYGVGFELA